MAQAIKCVANTCTKPPASRNAKKRDDANFVTQSDWRVDRRPKLILWIRSYCTAYLRSGESGYRDDCQIPPDRLVKGKSIREIARDLNLSRNTVRRVLRSGETSSSVLTPD
jgi:hypothetical protein